MIKQACTSTQSARTIPANQRITKQTGLLNKKQRLISITSGGGAVAQLDKPCHTGQY
jgi:hypothetical protein